MTIIRTPEYEIHYDGGRLADVYFNGYPMECVQVRSYDFATGEFGPVPTPFEIKWLVRAFIESAGGVQVYLNNLPPEAS